MDIKSLLEEYAVIMDDMEAESGLNTVIEPEKKKEEKNESVNEEKDLAEKPADMEKAEYKDMKIKKPEVDTVASKLLKQCEDLETAPKKYIVQDLDLNSNDPVPDSQDQFDDLNDAMACLKRRNAEEPDKYIEVVDTENDTIIASTDEIEDGTLTEEFKGETFKHYSKFNKCKDVKEIKDLIKTIRDDIKDEDDKDRKAELKDDLAKAKNLLKMAQDLKKNESKINEVDLATAQKVNDIRNYNAIKKTIDMKKSDNPADREIAKEAKKKAEKSNKLFRKWKKAKGIEESKKVGE